MGVEKQYLGDGVYAELVDTCKGVIKLTTENGGQVTNTIYLEPMAFMKPRLYNALVDFVEACREEEHGLQTSQPDESV